MTALWVIAAVIVFAGAVLRRMGDQRIQRARRPGEDLPAHPNTPVSDDMVLLRTVNNEEAQVVRGLLETSGIPVAMRSADPLQMMVSYGRRPPQRFDVYVPADRAEEAAALLAGP